MEVAKSEAAMLDDKSSLNFCIYGYPPKYVSAHYLRESARVEVVLNDHRLRIDVMAAVKLVQNLESALAEYFHATENRPSDACPNCDGDH